MIVRTRSKPPLVYLQRAAIEGNAVELRAQIRRGADLEDASVDRRVPAVGVRAREFDRPRARLRHSDESRSIGDRARINAAVTRCRARAHGERRNRAARVRNRGAGRAVEIAHGQIDVVQIERAAIDRERITGRAERAAAAELKRARVQRVPPGVGARAAQHDAAGVRAIIEREPPRAAHQSAHREIAAAGVRPFLRAVQDETAHRESRAAIARLHRDASRSDGQAIRAGNIRRARGRARERQALDREILRERVREIRRARCRQKSRPYSSRDSRPRRSFRPRLS